MIIKNGTVFYNGEHFENLTISIKGNRIDALYPKHTDSSIISQETAIYDADGLYVVPGFTDIHFHGAVGCDLCDADLDGLEKIAAYELQNGITQICPATMTMPKELLKSIASCAFKYQQNPTKADLVGIHLEGPFISSAKKGAQNEKYITPPDSSLLDLLEKDAPSLIKLITLAPELPNAMDFIDAVHDKEYVSRLRSHLNASCTRGTGCGPRSEYVLPR